MITQSSTPDAMPTLKTRRWVFCLVLMGSILLAARVIQLHLRDRRFVSAPDAPTPSTSRLICQEPNHDFGNVAASTSASFKHDFILKNTADRPIRILKKTSSCGCTTAKLSKEIIEPGATLVVPVSVDWAHRSGVQSARVSLLTDENASSFVDLNVRGNLERGIVISPQSVDLGESDPGPSAEKTIDVLAGTAECRILRITTPNPAVRIRRISDDSKAASIEGGPGKFGISVMVDRTPGSQQAILSVYTSSGTEPLPVSINWRSRGAITVSRESLVFDLDKQPFDERATINVRVAPGADVANLAYSIESKTGNPQFEIHETQIAASDGRIDVWFDVRLTGVSGPIALAALHFTCGNDKKDLPIIVMGRHHQPH